MKTFIELKNDTLSTMEKSRALAVQLNYPTVAGSIGETMEEFRKKEMMVVVVGEARRGKSSLLNALLSETSSVFPVDVNVCTNVVTIVRYGEKEKIEALIEDSRRKEGLRSETITREQIQDYVSEKGNPNNYKNVKVLTVSIPNELLKEGVVFVDTPGVGSMNISHAETTYGFLPNADLLLFVSDSNSGLTETEINFLKRGYKYCRNILFPLTKKDLNPDFQVIADDNRNKISHALGIPEDSVEIIPVSSTLRLRGLERNSRAMYASSNFPEFERAIWTNIARNRAEIMILPYLLEVKEELYKITDNVAAQYQLLNGDREKTEELIGVLNSEILTLNDLQQDSAEWKNQLTLFCTRLSAEASDSVYGAGDEARVLLDKRVAQYGTKICDESIYSEVMHEINDIIVGKSLDVKSDIENKIDIETDKINRELGLDLDINKEALQRMKFAPDKKLPVAFPEKKVTDRVLKTGRNISMNSSAGTVVGGILGGIVGFCLGGPLGAQAGVYWGGGIGATLGATKGCVDSLRKYDNLDVNVVKSALQQHISKSVRNVNSAVSNAITEVRLSLISTFEQKLKKRIGNINDNIQKMKERIKLANSEIPAKMADLEKQDRLLQAHRKQLEDLEETIVSFSADENAWSVDMPVQEETAMQRNDDTKKCAEDGMEKKTDVAYGFL